MRKITREAVRAFLNWEKFNQGNTSVIPGVNGAVMTLHGSTIAASQHGRIRVTSAGWETSTTKERLNGILQAIGCQGIYQKDYVWYWDDGTEFGTGWQLVMEHE